MTLFANLRTHGLDLVRDDQVWRQHAACSPSVAEWFWPVGKTGRAGGINLTESNRAALQLCASCPVQRDCREYETANPSPFIRIAGGQVFGTKTVARSTLRAPYRRAVPVGAVPPEGQP